MNSINYKGYTIEIQQDEFAQSPREDDNLGTMICGHRRYNLGDVQVRSSDELQEKLQEMGEVIQLPLYLYDHSGITMNTTGFSCPWDSGQVGIIAVSVAKVKKEYQWKVLTKKRREKICDYLRSEVETYDHYIRGNVWGYVVKDKDGEEIDSCWGFIGDSDDEYMISQAKAAADYDLSKVGEQTELALV